jgi:hypothetical protein
MKLALRNQSRSLPGTTNQRKNTLTGISILNRAADAIIHGLLSQVVAAQRILDVLSTNRKLGGYWRNIAITLTTQQEAAPWEAPGS